MASNPIANWANEPTTQQVKDVAALPFNAAAQGVKYVQNNVIPAAKAWQQLPLTQQLKQVVAAPITAAKSGLGYYQNHQETVRNAMAQPHIDSLNDPAATPEQRQYHINNLRSIYAGQPQVLQQMGLPNYDSYPAPAGR
jgi:hypothetical protein